MSNEAQKHESFPIRIARKIRNDFVEACSFMPFNAMWTTLLATVLLSIFGPEWLAITAGVGLMASLGWFCIALVKLGRKGLAEYEKSSQNTAAAIERLP